MSFFNPYYPWASLELRREISMFNSVKSVNTFRRKRSLCQCDERDVIVVPCEPDEPVCRDESVLSPFSFTFVYAAVFEKLGLRLPYINFEKELLTILNVSPAQLHSNSWAFVRGFHILCTHFGIVPTANMFLYFFTFRTSSNKLIFASLNGVSVRALLTLYQSSYKGYQGSFLKLRAPDHNLCLLEGFSLYWTQQPHLQSPRQTEDLGPSEQKDCLMLENLLLNYEFKAVDLKNYIENIMTMSKAKMLRWLKQQEAKKGLIVVGGKSTQATLATSQPDQMISQPPSLNIPPPTDVVHLSL